MFVVGIGLTLDNVWTKFDGISFGACCFSLVLNSVVFLLLCLFAQLWSRLWFRVQNVTPRFFMLLQNTLLLQRIFGGKKPGQPKLLFSAVGNLSTPKDVYKVQVRNLSVVLSPQSSLTVAVKGISFDAQDRSSTVLLGRNGSGKTTVISVLAGKD